VWLRAAAVLPRGLVVEVLPRGLVVEVPPQGLLPLLHPREVAGEGPLHVEVEVPPLRPRPLVAVGEVPLSHPLPRPQAEEDERPQLRSLRWPVVQLQGRPGGLGEPLPGLAEPLPRV